MEQEKSHLGELQNEITELRGAMEQENQKLKGEIQFHKQEIAQLDIRVGQLQVENDFQSQDVRKLRNQLDDTKAQEVAIKVDYEQKLEEYRMIN